MVTVTHVLRPGPFRGTALSPSRCATGKIVVSQGSALTTPHQKRGLSSWTTTNTDPIPWFGKFKLKLQLHHVSEDKHHAYLYSRSGGTCQAWLDNLLSKYGVVATDLYTKISWDDLKAAWHKRFQVELPEIKAMDKLMTFEQGTLPSVDWIVEYQRLTSVPDIQMGFKAVKHYFISRSCPALGNALTHVEDTLTTTAELFDKATQIIVTNKEAKNLHRSSATGLSRDQHRLKIVVVEVATPTDQTSSAVRTKHERDSAIVYGVTAISTTQWVPIERQRQIGSLSTARSESTALSTSSEPVASQVNALHSEAHAKVDSPPLLYSYEDYAVRNVPTLGTHAQGQDVCVASSPSDNGDLSSSSGSSQDSAHEFNKEVLDPITSKGFAWLPLSTTGRLPGPQCAALCAHLHTYLSFYAPPTSPTDDEVAVGDILAYVTKVAREFRKQRYDNNNAPLLYVRIQVGQASCNALLDSGASRNFMSQAFMQRAGLGTQVWRKANPTAIKLADERTQQLIDRYIDAVPVYFTPHACEPVTFDILDTDFDIILGMPWLPNADHTINFHRRTLTRKLNVQTVKNAGSLPRIDDLLERLSGAFKTWYGHFEWVVMPFGLTNAPSTFQAAMTNEFRAMLDWFVLVYLDDILVHSRSLEDHLEHLRRVLETLRLAKYKANHDKSEFVWQELEYLDHFVTPEGSNPLSDKIQAIQEWPEPRNVTNVLRIYDPLLPTRVTTDASGYGIGVVLEQHDGVDWHPVEYFSKKAPVVHSIDDARKKELLAFVHALKRWQHFLLGQSQFQWATDNNPLVFYKTQDTINSTIARWIAFIDQFDFFPDHIPGKSNRFANALSWHPDRCTAVYSTLEIGDDLRESFIRGYQADHEVRDKYANCSSPNPTPSHYRIQEGYLLVHTRGKDLLCVPSDFHLRTWLLGEFQDAPATGHCGVNRRLADFASDFGGPTFSAMSHAIASHARFVNAANPATIVRTRNMTIFPGDDRKTHHLWTVFKRSATSSPSDATATGQPSTWYTLRTALTKLTVG
ncbi:hypothetical protein CBR_g35036 [Chara braunii]|uniref:RNA-directed DNA polymerase n=1 Tax=Chara braunii TaxID=69332 RepID=A0A388LK80_CHABU|nr:hypothetical protein CBR_g35036 [Chara braunii]|eukprot:GBG82671.1 hypothetical protein CBR_g35036 [Chara braunii]